MFYHLLLWVIGVNLCFPHWWVIYGYTLILGGVSYLSYANSGLLIDIIANGEPSCGVQYLFLNIWVAWASQRMALFVLMWHPKIKYSKRFGRKPKIMVTVPKVTAHHWQHSVDNQVKQSS